MTNAQRNQLDQIETQFANTVNRATGASVEVTMRTPECWTISGELCDDTRRAAQWLADNKLMVIEGEYHDAEDERSYFYLQAVTV